MQRFMRALLTALFLINCGCATEMVKRLPKQIEDVGEAKSACIIGNQLFVDYLPYIYRGRIAAVYDKEKKPSSVGDQQRVAFELSRIGELSPREFFHSSRKKKKRSGYTRKKLIELVYEPETYSRGGRFIPIGIAKSSTSETKCDSPIPVYAAVDDAITANEPIAFVLERFGDAPENYYEYLVFQDGADKIDLISLPHLPLQESDNPALKVVSYALYPLATVWDVATFPLQIPLAMRSLGDGATHSFP